MDGDQNKDAKTEDLYEDGFCFLQKKLSTIH